MRGVVIAVALITALLTLGAAYPVPTTKPASVAFVKAGEGHGSGVFVFDGLHTITARHVVEGEALEGLRVIDVTGGLHNVVKVEISKTSDFAMLTLDKPAPVEPSPIDCKKPDVLTQLKVVGYPLDFGIQTRFVRVSGYGQLADFDYGEGFITWIDGTIIPGDSGGPVFSETGVVGLVSGIIVNGPQGSTWLAFITPLYLEPMICGGSRTSS